MWNLQYATLTDKAADDFATIPGLAESWEASDDGLTYTYTLREGLKWSDGEPLTADDVAYTINRSRDEEWPNHYSTTVANLDATAIDDAHRRDHELGARPEAADDGRLHRPQAHLRDARRRRDPRVRRARRRRVGPVLADRVAVGSGLDDGEEPELVRAATTASTASCSACSPTPTRWWPRCSRARSTSPTTSRTNSVELLEDDDEHRGRRRPAGRLHRAGAQRWRRRDRRRSPGAAGHQRPPRDLLRDRPRRAVRPRRARPRRQGHDDVAVGRPDAGCPTSATSSTPTTPTAPTRSSTTPATSTPTATACARCPTAAARSSSATPSDPSRSIAAPIREFVTEWLRRHRHRHRRSSVMDDTQLYDVQVAGQLRHVRVGLDAVRRPRPDARRTSRATRSPPIPTTPGRTTPTGAAGVRRALRAAEGRARPRPAARDRRTRCCGCSTASRRISCCSRTPTCRPTAPTASRGGCGSRPRPARCCSPTPRRRTPTCR